MAESKSKSLPWKRAFDMPQVPPPSRSPSKTNVAWVRVRNKGGKMNIRGLLRTKRELEEFQPTNKENVLLSTGNAQLSDKQNVMEKDVKNNTARQATDFSTLKRARSKSNEINRIVNVNLEQREDTISHRQQSLRMCEGKPVKEEEAIKQLAPTVKGLQVPRAEMGGSVKQNLVENSRAVHEQATNSHLQNEFIEDSKNEDRNDFPSERRKVRNRKSPKNSGSDRKKTVCTSASVVKDRADISKTHLHGIKKESSKARDSIGSSRSATPIHQSRSNIDRKSSENIRKKTKDIDRDAVGDSRTGNDYSRSGRNISEARKNSDKRICLPSKKMSTEQLPRNKSDLQAICIRAKHLATVVKPTAKTKKKRSTMKKTSNKQQSANDMNVDHAVCHLSVTDLPRRSCSASAVETSLRDAKRSGTRIKLKSAASASIRTGLRSAIGSEMKEQEGRRCCSPVSILLPSQLQLEKFDNVAKLKLRKTLALQMRKHCYTGAWAYPPSQLRAGVPDAFAGDEQ